MKSPLRTPPSWPRLISRQKGHSGCRHWPNKVQMAMLSTRHQPWKRIFTLFVLPFFLLCALIARFRHRDPVLRAASAAPVNDLQRIAKASMLYGQYNNLYERALRSHARHAQRWGYPMHVLRHDISVGFWSKPTYLLSLVLQELRKPAEERVDWLL